MSKIDLCSMAEKSGTLKSKVCKKPKPTWEDRNNGTELLQKINSQPSVAINKKYKFEDLEYNGTMYIKDKSDNDWVGFVFGYKDVYNFYAVISNRQSLMGRAERPMWWSIKRIQVNDTTQTITHSKLLESLRSQDALPGYTVNLWEDPKKGQWASGTPIRWNVVHKPYEGLIRLKMYVNNEQIIDSGDIKEKHPIMGGKIGLYISSQEQVLFSKLSYSCGPIELRVSEDNTVEKVDDEMENDKIDENYIETDADGKMERNKEENVVKNEANATNDQEEVETTEVAENEAGQEYWDEYGN